MMPLTPVVWKHFSKINSDTVKRNKLKEVLKCKGSSTSWLSIHAKTHKITINKTVTTATLVAETDYRRIKIIII
jgi:2-iminoacetate synthase ThiH